MRRFRLSAAAAGLVATCLTASCSHPGRPATPGGPQFALLANRLNEGTPIRVTLADRRSEGTIARIDADSLTLLTRDGRDTIACAQVRRVETRGDAVWPGAVAGAAMAALPAWNGCQNKGRNISCVVVGVGTFAAIGALIDRAHAGFHTIYAAAPDSCSRPSPARPAS